MEYEIENKYDEKKIKRNMSKHLTDYATATNWCKNVYIKLNEIAKIDPKLTFAWRHSVRQGFYCYKGKNDDFSKFSMFFLSDMNIVDAEFLRKTFDLQIAYSPKLGLFVLCVKPCGAGWDITDCKVKSKKFWASHGKDIVLKY